VLAEEQQKEVAQPIAGQRPNTQQPDTVLAVDSNDLENLNDEELIKFADEKLGIVIPSGTKRSIILMKIVNAAIGTNPP
jgi:hypothetical protein